jgi:hypothetical protein
MLPAACVAVFLQSDAPSAAVKELEKHRNLDLYLSTQMVPDYSRGLAYLENKQAELAARDLARRRALLWQG